MKTRSQTPKKATDAELEKLAQMADKPYVGAKEEVKEREPKMRCSLQLPISLVERIETMAGRNKIGRSGPTNLSAIIREAVIEYMDKNE